MSHSEKEKESASYIVNNYDAVNSHIDELVSRNKLITVLGLERIALLRSKRVYFLLVGVGLFILLSSGAVWLLYKTFLD